MTDIVERLRQVISQLDQLSTAEDTPEHRRKVIKQQADALDEAADEIERLQAQIDTLRELREFDRTEIERLRAALQEIIDAEGWPYHLEIANKALRGEKIP